VTRYLPIYLNDHLAGATLGVEIARRTLRENGDAGELAEFLRWLHAQLVEDRQALLALMKRHDVQPSIVKSGAAWFGEKLGRLKPNGHVRTYSPLSRLLELEALAAGIDAKLGLWLALDAAGVDDLGTLIARAREQRERLEPHRLAAARDAV
jgi:hypothetical protein